MRPSPPMFLRANHRDKDGKRHTYWSLVETVRTADGPRQRTLCHLGELNDSAQARWLKTIDVFNDAGERHQLKLFPSEVAPPPDDAEVAQVLVQRVRLERTRQMGPCKPPPSGTCRGSNRPEARCGVAPHRSCPWRTGPSGTCSSGSSGRPTWSIHA